MTRIARSLAYLLLVLVSSAWAAGPGTPPKEGATGATREDATKDKGTWLDMRASELIG